MSDGKALTMEEREEPRFVKFGAGDVVEGILANIERVSISGKPAVRYTVKEAGGQYVSFIGTHQLNTKLRFEDKGHQVDICCEGEDVTVRRGENNMKVFKVRVSKERVGNVAAPVATDGTEITDDDIPF